MHHVGAPLTLQRPRGEFSSRGPSRGELLFVVGPLSVSQLGLLGDGLFVLFLILDRPLASWSTLQTL
jgi:hypothetical protein